MRSAHSLRSLTDILYTCTFLLSTLELKVGGLSFRYNIFVDFLLENLDYIPAWDACEKIDDFHSSVSNRLCSVNDHKSTTTKASWVK